MASRSQGRRNIFTQSAEPPNIAEVESAIQAARAMLDWGDDWDGEGSPGYSEETWQRAGDFLMRSTRELWHRHQGVVPMPEIEPGPNGSLDFHWQMEDREMLLNLPAEQDALLDFYGDSSAGEVIKGRAHASTVGPWLLAWLTR